MSAINVLISVLGWGAGGGGGLASILLGGKELGGLEGGGALQPIHLKPGHLKMAFFSALWRLGGPRRAPEKQTVSLRYLILRDTFQGRLPLPQNGAIPPLGT